MPLEPFRSTAIYKEPFKELPSSHFRVLFSAPLDCRHSPCTGLVGLCQLLEALQVVLAELLDDAGQQVLQAC